MGQRLGLAAPLAHDCGQHGMTAGCLQAGTFRTQLEGPALPTLPGSEHLRKGGAAQLSQGLGYVLGESRIRHPCSADELSCSGGWKWDPGGGPGKCLCLSQERAAPSGRSISLWWQKRSSERMPAFKAT